MFYKALSLLVIFTLFLLSMIGIKQWTLTTGIPVLLETQPIDPRSLFRGDYVRLNYKISNLKLTELEGSNNFNRHDKIYVELEKSGKYWKPTTLHNSHPQTENLVLLGKVQYVNENTWNPDLEKSENITTLSVNYGIEHFFVPEGEGLDLERRDNDQIVDIRVAIDTWGKAGIKEVLVNNEIRYKETLL